LFPNFVFYPAMLCMVCNLAQLYINMSGAMVRGEQGIIGKDEQDPYENVMHWPITPIYWTLMSLATVKAFWELVFAPGKWHKTKRTVFAQEGLGQIVNPVLQPIEMDLERR
jgi:glycosyltransferase XagB